MTFRKLISIPILIASALLAANTISVFAASSPTVSLSLTASVAAKCIISATSTVNFGVYDPVITNSPTGANLDSTGTVSVQCTRGSGISVTFDNGANASGAQRRMSGGTEFLNYQLYIDAARTVILTTGFITTAPNTNPRTYTIFGRVPRGQSVAPNAYSDTVQTHVNF